MAPEIKERVANVSQPSVCFIAPGRMNQTEQILLWLKSRHEFRLNDGNHRMEHRKAGSSEWEYMSDEVFNSIKVNLNLDGIDCSRENLKTIIGSDQWPVYNPYELWLENLPVWDTNDYIKDVAARVKTKDDKYWEWCFRKWLVAFVASLADDKVVNHTAPILCSPTQGNGKTSFIETLIPDELRQYTASGFINPKDKETQIQLSELALFCLDECENMTPKNVEALKEIITRPKMYLRRAYTTYSKFYTRRTSFCGTSNETGILWDTTGNRRFLCQEVVGLIDNSQPINHGQLYAQAYQLYRSGFQYWFDQEEQKRVEEHNARFRHVTTEEEILDTFFEPCSKHDKEGVRYQTYELIADLQTRCRGFRISDTTLGKLLSKKGFEKHKSNGISRWVLKPVNREEAQGNEGKEN